MLGSAWGLLVVAIGLGTSGLVYLHQGQFLERALADCLERCRGYGKKTGKHTGISRRE